MSLKFVAASGTYAYTLTEPVTAEAFTISVWFRDSNNSNNVVIVAIDTPDTVGYQILGCIEASGGVAQDPVRAYNYNGSDYGIATTSSGYSKDTWTHACGVFTSNVLRAAFIDGGSKGTNADNRAGTPSELVIGVRRRNDPVGYYHSAQGLNNGFIAEVAVWSSALSDANVALLAGGTNPQDIEAGSLEAYWPLVDDALDDAGSNDLTVVNAAWDSGEHPSIDPPGGEEETGYLACNSKFWG